MVHKMLMLFLMVVFVFAMSSMASANATKGADQSVVEKAGAEVALMIVQGSDVTGAQDGQIGEEMAIQIMQKSEATKTARLETGGVAFIHSPTEDANADHNPDPVGTSTTTDVTAMLNSSTSATTSSAATAMYFGEDKEVALFMGPPAGSQAV